MRLTPRNDAFGAPDVAAVHAATGTASPLAASSTAHQPSINPPALDSLGRPSALRAQFPTQAPQYELTRDKTTNQTDEGRKGYRQDAARNISASLAIDRAALGETDEFGN